jgi:hypothetical protein
MSVVKLVELINKNLQIKPVFFDLKNFFGLDKNPFLHYYSFNKFQSMLGEYFKFFISSSGDENIRVKLEGEKLHMDSFSYYSLVLENIFEKLKELYGNRFNNFSELEKVSQMYEFEYEHISSIKGFNVKNYSKTEKEIFDEMSLCKQYKESMKLIEINLSKSKIYSQYFSEVDETIGWLREKGNKIKDLKNCNSYLLNLYGLKEFIPKLVGNLL